MRPSRPKTPRRDKNLKLKAGKDPIEVYCRIRPVDDVFKPCIRAVDDQTIALDPPEAPQNKTRVHYQFKHVFDDSTTQKELFDYVCLPLVKDVLSGSNGLLFTYGISSSGKTHTITGSPQDGGLLPRSLDVIFNSVKDMQAKKFVFKPDKMNGFDVQSPADALTEQQRELSVFNKNKRKNKKEGRGDFSSRIPDNTVCEDLLPDMCFSVFVSYVEIYKNYIYDLLEDTDTSKTSRSVKIIRTDAADNTYVFGVKETEVKTVEEALELFYEGQRQRTTCHTLLNTESSRSHSVFTIRIVQAPLDPTGAEVFQDKDRILISQLSLVDLAGSERLVRTKNTGDKIAQAGDINSSLSVLKKCIEALRESQTQGISKVVPYRESKLTHLFKTFFEGDGGKIKMIVCVNPHPDNYEETIHVMRFAEITQNVEVPRHTPASTPITGLGRRYLYKEALRQAQEQGVHISEIPTVYTLGPEFPQLIFDDCDDESAFINLIDFLTARIAKRNSLVGDLERRQQELRENLHATDKEILELKRENQILQVDLDAREQQIRNLEQKLCSLVESCDLKQRQLERQNDDYKRKAENASKEVNEKEKIIKELRREKERMEIRLKDKIASTKEQMKKHMDEKMAEVKRKMCLGPNEVRQLRDIINANADKWDECFADANFPGARVPSTTESESSGPVTRRKRRSAEIEELATETRFPKAKSSTDVYNNNGLGGQFPSQSSKNTTDAVFYKENRPPVSASNSKSIVVANPRHRRSTSTGDMWIEHKPVGNLELNTVLQPAMKKKKSVSKLEVKDVTNSEKYVLQHQEQDSQGEVETQLFKADIVPSAGGGAQVIFNDVEKLRQVSPPPNYNLRKRSGDNLPLREIEDRCTVSVECHGLPSKIMKK